MRHAGSRKRFSLSVQSVLVLCLASAAIGFLMLNIPTKLDYHDDISEGIDYGSSDNSSEGGNDGSLAYDIEIQSQTEGKSRSSSCATVEEMGEVFKEGPVQESLRVRKIIHNHFDLNGASKVRRLPPDQFCRHGFVMAKASEAGFGNEMYKILTSAALSIMLNRSLIIGQTRGRFPFGEYISYSNLSFTLKEIKHLWRYNACQKKYKRNLIMRTDNFEKPSETNVLCDNWREWDQPIIWFQGTTDAVAIQFFLKNIHPEMRSVASYLFGRPDVLKSRPNVFGELMRVLISPSKDIEEAVNWVLHGGADPDISLHMRMLMNKSVRALMAASKCIEKAMLNLNKTSRPRVVLVSDTPSMLKSIMLNLTDFAEVLHFDYQAFEGNISGDISRFQKLNFRKDWGPAPRWVAFVDFFLAARAQHFVVSAAHRRVGTTYAQLIAALAAAHNLDESSTGSSFAFLSSFQSNLLREGLKIQVGWGHAWNRFAGPLSCQNQPNQCAFTPLLPPGWWDGLLQSPIPRDIHRLADYGIQLSGLGTINENLLHSFCSTRKNVVRTIPLIISLFFGQSTLARKNVVFISVRRSDRGFLVNGSLPQGFLVNGSLPQLNSRL